MQLVSDLDRFGYIADKSSERAASAQHAEQYVTGIDLRQAPIRQFELVVSGAIGERAHGDAITGARHGRSWDDENRLGHVEYRSCRADLVGVNDVDCCFHLPAL